MDASLDEIIEKLVAAEPYLTCLLAVTGEAEEMPILYANSRFWGYLGYSLAEADGGYRIESLSELMTECIHGRGTLLQEKSILDATDIWRAKCCLRGRQGEQLPARCLSRRFFADDGHIIWIHQFMPMEDKESGCEAEMAEGADPLLRLDYLTGILNRSAFTKAVTGILDEWGGQRHAFIMLDIDCFKQINDRKGHAYGDTVLQSIAGKLQNFVGKEDLCGRLGGDEFVVFLKDISDRRVIMDKLNGFCKELCIKSEVGGAYTCSLGAALYPEDGRSFEDLYRNADKAMYYVKRRGKNGFAVYDKEMDL